jgi:Fe2+ transport system protein FeoA
MTISLAEISPDERIELAHVPDDDARARLLRLGFLDGRVECHRQIPEGPVVLRRHGTEIALGRALAREIGVDRPDDAQS